MPARRGVFVLLASFTFMASTAAAALPPGLAAAAVAWPASSGLVVAEVVTGGGTASAALTHVRRAAGSAVSPRRHFGRRLSLNAAASAARLRLCRKMVGRPRPADQLS